MKYTLKVQPVEEMTEEQKRSRQSPGVELSLIAETPEEAAELLRMKPDEPKQFLGADGSAYEIVETSRSDRPYRAMRHYNDGVKDLGDFRTYKEAREACAQCVEAELQR